MKFRFTFCVLCCCWNFVLSAQVETQIGEAFGIDILPTIIALGGGTTPYDEIELIYRATDENQRQLRLKLNFNNRAIINKEEVFAAAAPSPCGNVTPMLTNTYTPSRNIHVAAGVGKYIPHLNFPVYYGMDVNLGVNRGKVAALHEVCGTNDTLLIQPAGELNAFSYLVGITPFLGTELTLNRLTLIIEFGFSANYNFGHHPYLDTELKEQEVKVSRFDFILNRYLNDFAIVYRF